MSIPSTRVCTYRVPANGGSLLRITGSGLYRLKWLPLSSARTLYWVNTSGAAETVPQIPSEEPDGYHAQYSKSSCVYFAPNVNGDSKQDGGAFPTIFNVIIKSFVLGYDSGPIVQLCDVSSGSRPLRVVFANAGYR
jgi:hypothetical protein